MARATIERAEQLAASGRLLEAEAVCREILRARAGHVAASRLLGRVLREAGKGDAAIAVLRPLYTERPHDPTVARELGAALTQAGQVAAAKPLLSRALAALPDCPETRRWLGRAHMHQLELGPAIAQFQAASRAEPANPENRRLLAAAHLAAGRAEQAETIVRELIELAGEAPETMTLLGQSLEHQSRTPEALAAYRRAIALADRPAEFAVAGVVRCLHAEGRLEEARAVAEEAHDRAPSSQTAIAFAQILVAQRQAELAASTLEKAIARAGPAAGSELHFLLGHARQTLGRYDDAFAAFKSANAISTARFSAERLEAEYAALRSVHEALPPADDPTLGSGCAFVVGMPRSGTTLVEQIIDSHPHAHGGGEMQLFRRLLVELVERRAGSGLASLADAPPDELRDAARAFVEHCRAVAPAAAIVVDKTPHNFELLGFIDRLLPGARVIHCRRNAVDTCLSCYTMQLSPWHAYATDLEALGAAYGAYVRLADHWQSRLAIPILTVEYESVVDSLDSEVRRILQFLGLPEHEACFRFWENARTVSTPSADQVRRPIYRGSVERWKRYESHLAPLIDALRRQGVGVD